MNEYEKIIFKNQLDQNLIELNNNYPKHWYQLIDDLNYLTKNYNIKRVIDIGCGCGATKELLFRHYPNITYYGYDYSNYAIEIAKNTWNYDKFYVKNCFDFTESDFEKTDAVYLSAIGDVLNNADELFEKYLIFNINYLFLYRVRFTDEKSYFLNEINDNNFQIFSYWHNKDNLIKNFMLHNYEFYINDNNSNSKNILLIKK